MGAPSMSSSKSRIRISTIPYNQWEGWNDQQFRPSHFYQSREWFDVLTKTWSNLKIEILLAGDTVALPIFVQQRGPLRLIGSPLRGFFSPYGGFFDGSTILEFSQLLKGDFCEATLFPGIHAMGDWKKQKTIILDLTCGIDALWSGLDKDARNQVRQAERFGVEIKDINNTSWVDPYYELVKTTYLRQRLPVPASISFYRSIAQQLVPNQAKVLLAYTGATVIAGGIFGFHGNTIYFLDGASDRKYQNLRSNNLIQWHIIKWAVNSGLTTYDMIGANIPGIAKFKLSFGGHEVEYMAMEWTPTVLGKIAWKIYQKFRSQIKKINAGRTR